MAQPGYLGARVNTSLYVSQKKYFNQMGFWIPSSPIGDSYAPYNTYKKVILPAEVILFLIEGRKESMSSNAKSEFDMPQTIPSTAY